MAIRDNIRYFWAFGAGLLLLTLLRIGTPFVRFIIASIVGLLAAAHGHSRRNARALREVNHLIHSNSSAADSDERNP